MQIWPQNRGFGVSFGIGIGIFFLLRVPTAGHKSIQMRLRSCCSFSWRRSKLQDAAISGLRVPAAGRGG